MSLISVNSTRILETDGLFYVVSDLPAGHQTELEKLSLLLTSDQSDPVFRKAKLSLLLDCSIFPCIADIPNRLMNKTHQTQCTSFHIRKADTNIGLMCKGL